MNRFETGRRKKNNALFNRRLFSKAIYDEPSKLLPRPLLIETPLVSYRIALIGTSALSLFLSPPCFDQNTLKCRINNSTSRHFSRTNKPLVASGRALFSRERNWSKPQYFPSTPILFCLAMLSFWTGAEATGKAICEERAHKQEKR